VSRACWDILLAYFQVREVRTLMFVGTSLLFHVVYDCLSLLAVMDVWYGGIVVWGMPSSLLQVKTVAGTDKLAQVS